MAGNGRQSSRFPSTPPPSIFCEPYAPLYTTTPEPPQRSGHNPPTAAGPAGARAPPLPPTTLRPHEVQRQRAAPSEPYLLRDDFPEVYGAQEGWAPLPSRSSARPSPTPAASTGTPRHTSASPSIRQVTSALERLTLPAYVSPNTQMPETSHRQVVIARQGESVRKPRETRKSDKLPDTRRPTSSKPEASTTSSAYIGRPTSSKPEASTTSRAYTGPFLRPHQTATALAPPNPTIGRVLHSSQEDSREGEPTSWTSRPHIDYRPLYNAAAPPHLQPPPASYNTAAPRAPRASGVSTLPPVFQDAPETVPVDLQSELNQNAYAGWLRLQGPGALVERDRRAAELAQAVARSGAAASQPVSPSSHGEPVAHRSDEELDSDERDRAVRQRLRDRHEQRLRDSHDRHEAYGPVTLAEAKRLRYNEKVKERRRSHKNRTAESPSHTGETYGRAPLPEPRGPTPRRRRHSPREYSPQISDGETDNDERNRRPRRQQEHDNGTRSQRARDETERQSKSKRGKSKK